MFTTWLSLNIARQFAVKSNFLVKNKRRNVYIISTSTYLQLVVVVVAAVVLWMWPLVRLFCSLCTEWWMDFFLLLLKTICFGHFLFWYFMARQQIVSCYINCLYMFHFSLIVSVVCITKVCFLLVWRAQKEIGKKKLTEQLFVAFWNVIHRHSRWQKITLDVEC